MEAHVERLVLERREYTLAQLFIMEKLGPSEIRVPWVATRAAISISPYHHNVEHPATLFPVKKERGQGLADSLRCV